MHCFKMVAVAAVWLGLSLLTPASSFSDDWPQWRGARLDSTSGESGLPNALNEETRAWRFEMPGPGGSSPVVVGNKIYVTTIGGDDESELWLMCLGTDGELKWQQPLEGTNQKTRDRGNSASPSPIADGDHVWGLMTNGIVHCFTADGSLVWKKDLQKAYGEFNIQFGMTSTPILDQGRLYFQLIHGDFRDRRSTSVGWVVSLDAKTGEEVWVQKRITDAIAENKHSYASPSIYRDQDRSFLVTHGGDFVIGHALDDGRELWRCGGINVKGETYNPYLRFVSSPVCVPGMVIVPSAKGGPVLALRADQLSGDVTGKPEAIAWKMEKGTPDVASPVIADGVMYLARERGIVLAVDANNGTVLHEERMLSDQHRSTPVVADGKVYISERDGTMTVLKADQNVKKLSEFELNEETTASPAVANGRVYVRTFNAIHAFGKEKKTGNKMKYAIAIHGGAGSSPSRFNEEANQRRRDAMKKALEIGTEVLKNGGSSLNAVEKVVNYLEDEPQFNAGVGAVFNAAGKHELDASIMNGNDRSCGAVAGVTIVKNPISLARKVMTETRHVLLAGPGAEAFAKQQGVDLVEPEHFDTPATLKKWEQFQERLKKLNAANDREALDQLLVEIQDEDTGSYMGTVGCVALDSNGNLAAATSTGGMTNKKFGRVGDSPIVGAGTFADNASCAVSGTGIGEQYIRNAVAYDVAAQMLYKNRTLEEAVNDNLQNRLNPGDGGIIAVDKDGNISMGFNTKGMARAAADSTGRFEVIWGKPAEAAIEK